MLKRCTFGMFLSLAAATLVACGGARSDQTGWQGRVPGVPAANAAPEVPSTDAAIPGRILVVKDGDLEQWSQGTLKRLAGGLTFQCPAFSPDGTRIAVSVVGDNHSDLVVLDSFGKRLAQLTDNWAKTRVGDSAWARHPTWSPDGRLIAYATDVLGTDLSLWSVDAGGLNRRQILPAPGWGGVDWPQWSPDGKEIALTAFEGDSSYLLLVNPSTGGTKKLSGGQEAMDAAWSPDGTHIAFAARRGGRTDIWVMNSAGENAVRLTDMGIARAPAWSPAGDQIAFLADDGHGFGLFVMKPNLAALGPVASSELRRLAGDTNLEAQSGLAWAR